MYSIIKHIFGESQGIRPKKVFGQGPKWPSRARTCSSMCVFMHFNYKTCVLLEVLFLSYDFTRCFYTPQPRCVQHNDDFYDVIMTYRDQNYDILECKCVILRSVYDILDFRTVVLPFVYDMLDFISVILRCVYHTLQFISIIFRCVSRILEFNGVILRRAYDILYFVSVILLCVYDIWEFKHVILLCVSDIFDFKNCYFMMCL